MYESDCDKVKFQFTRNTVIWCNRLDTLVNIDIYSSPKANINKDLVVSIGSLMLLINDWREGPFMKMKKQFWGALKQYSNCYNIICHFKPHSLHVFQIFILQYYIYVDMKFQVVLSTGVVFETIFFLWPYKIFPINWDSSPWQPVFIKYKWYWFCLVQ